MTQSFEHDRAPRASWYGIAMAIAAAILVIAAGLAVGLVIYYAL
jgi:hypothetical protein